MAMEQKSLVGAILFLIIFNAVQFIVRFGLMYWSYGLGTKAVTMLTSNAKEFTRAASILGIFVVGALIANYGSTTLRLIVGETQINVQGLLDGVLPKLIPLLINNAKQHKQLPVYGDGMNVRDWLYVEDHCKAIDMVANGGRVGEVYNVGGHNERPNIFIVKTIIAQLHERLADDGINEGLIKYVADRLGHDRRYGIDPTKIKNELGWYPETIFEVGIVKTIDWYLSHEEWMANVTSGNYQKYYEEMYKNR